MPLIPGEVLRKRYRIDTLLGQGGFGAVYRAWDMQIGADCAIKENLDISPASQTQFSQEAKLLFNLRHTNLPQVRDLFMIPNQGQYLVMDYIEGEDLDAMLSHAGQQLPQDQVVGWLSQVCQALTYLHSQSPPVIHRDIKPANIKITHQGKPVLVDFGIAKTYDPNLQTITGARAVTIGYSPPEQYGMGTTDARSDIYALGATAYTLLTNQSPPDAMDVISGKSSPPIPPHLLNSRVSQGLSAAIMQAMQPQLVDRFENARAFEHAMELGLKGTWAPAVTTLPPPTSPLHRHRKRFVWVSLLALVLGLTLAGIFIMRPLLEREMSANPTSRAAVLVVEPGTGTSTSSAQTVPTTIPVNPSTTLIATSSAQSPNPSITPTWVDLPTLSLPLATPIPVSPLAITSANVNQLEEIWHIGRGRVTEIAWSPGGEMLAIATVQGIYVLDAGTLNELQMMAPGEWVYSVEFSPDGAVLAASTGNLISLWNSRTGSLNLTIEINGNGVTDLSFSPDGRSLAMQSASGLSVWNLNSGEMLFQEQGGYYDSIAYTPDGEAIAGVNSYSSIHLVDASNGLEKWNKEGDWSGNIALSPDSNMLAAIYDSATIQFLRVSDGSAVLEINTPDANFDMLAFSADGSTLYGIETWFGTIRQWETGTGNLVQKLEVDGNLMNPSFSPDRLQLASVDEQGNLNIQGLDGELLRQSPSFYDSIAVLTFSPNGASFANSARGSQINITDVTSNENNLVLDRTSYHSDAAGFSPDASQFAALTSQGLTIWGLPEGIIKLDADVPGGSFWLEYSPDGALLASASYDTLRISSAADDTLLRSYSPAEQFRSLDLSPDGKTIAFSLNTTDGGILLWDVQEWSVKHILETSSSAYDLQFSPDGDFLAASYYKDNIMAVSLWSMDDWEQVTQFSSDNEYSVIQALTFSPDGSILAAGSWRKIFLWKVADGTLLVTLNGHQGSVANLTFSPDGRFLLSGGDDGTIRMWGLR